MSLASELLFNTSKGRKSEGEQHESADGAQTNWSDLNHIVYSLIDKHEPNPKLEAALRTDMRVMQLSGLVNEFSSCPTRKVCKEAATVMAELLRVLPRTK
jgi:hypothetical protein